MVWLKACPKCKGDLFLDEDHYGKYKSCIQCGYIKDLTDGPIAMPQATQPVPSSDKPWRDFIAAFPGA
jgi:uncharacterized protein YbaR (Trm112 family)